MTQTAALVTSYIFVFAIILVATVLQIILKLTPNFSRKIVHIGVGNWIFLVPLYFTDWYVALIPPVSFILINYLSYRYTWFKAMELEEKNPGTIYYAISLTIVTLMVFSRTSLQKLPYLGIMAMVWGDGMAAVIGQQWPIKRFRSGKSWGGTLAFFIFTLAAAAIYLWVNDWPARGQILWLSLLIAGLGSAIELGSPKKWDNLTVPILLALVGLLLE